MSGAVVKVLERLEALGFETRAGGFAPFGETLPLVVGVAWDTRTAQIALIAEMGDDDDLSEWQQLLFAGAGLRHHLSTDGPAAFGSPVILALVDDDGRRRLRDLAEDLASNYVVFSRVDLNLIRFDDLDHQERLDDALAPLLPRCRSMLEHEISRADVQRFWGLLRSAVAEAAGRLDPMFEAYREQAGRELADHLVGEDEGAPELPAPVPLDGLAISNFRSIRRADLELAPVTIVHGPNGGGKSSLLEAMEFVWAGTSLRKPAAVTAEEYGRHLPRGGSGTFKIIGDGEPIEDVAETPRAELRRNVLTHESVAALVSQSPEDRYAALLTTTGLEMPDLAARAEQRLVDAKKGADEALGKAGLPKLPMRTSLGIKHLRQTLGASLSTQLPSVHEVIGAEEAVVAASGETYVPRAWPGDEYAMAALIRAETTVASLLESPHEASGSVAPALAEARAQVKALVGPRREAVESLRRLLGGMRKTEGESGASATNSQPALPVDAGVAARWLSHTNAVKSAAERFRQDADGITSPRWAENLREYAAALDAAARVTRVSDLEAFGRRVPDPKPLGASRAQVAELYEAAGFTDVPTTKGGVADAVRALVAVLDEQIAQLDVLGRDLEGHPARRFHEHADSVLSALCRFELARQMRGAGPILDASETLVRELLQDRLAPVVRELVASIVRFEWYFEPLLVPDKGRKVVLGGLATSRADLDARLLLNSAERTAIGVAWFLALHLLQPEGRQQVLVLDDPTSAFDAPNQAGLISTLRAFVRLTRPRQLVIATHDETVASLLMEELSPVDAWPSASVKLRCQRNNADCSIVTSEPGYGGSLSLDEEAERLGLGVEPVSS